MVEQSIKKEHTSCQSCIFSLCKEGTQSGCKLGLVDKYRKQEGVDVLECYNEMGDFYVINGRRCFLKCLHKEAEDKTFEEMIELVRPRYISIIRWNWNTMPTVTADIYNYLERSIKGVVEQEHKPKTICPIIEFEHNIFLERKKVVHLLNDVVPKDMNWQIRVVQPDADVEQDFKALVSAQAKRYPIFQVVDYNSTVCPFFMRVLNEYSIMRDFRFAKINMDGFSVINSMSHKLLGGINKEMEIDKEDPNVDKIVSQINDIKFAKHLNYASQMVKGWPTWATRDFGIN